MPGGRERLTYIETNILRLVPLGIYETIHGPEGRRYNDLNEVNGYVLLGSCRAGNGGCFVQQLAA